MSKREQRTGYMVGFDSKTFNASRLRPGLITE